MRLEPVLVGATCLASANAAAVDSSRLHDTRALVPRALPANPSGYAPSTGPCPSNRPTLRNAGALSQQESDWLPKRRNNTIQPMIDFLSRVAIPGFNARDYINNHRNDASDLPNVGIALSGGGYRAMLNGAGIVEAFDSRTPNSTSAGQLGGVLQSATYIAGLSGGNWAVGSLYSNNYTSVYDIINHGSGDLWNIEQDIFTGPNQDSHVLGTLDYYHELLDIVDDKRKAGFNISITDYWGRALSYQLVNASEGGPSYTWSSVASQDFLTQGNAPLPILIADGRAPGEQLIPDNTTIYEFTPWEMGSWDPTVYGFAPMQYVGSKFSAGRLDDNEMCTTGFDNVGYVMGTSSSLFNQGLIQLNGSADAQKLPGFVRDALTSILGDLGEDNDDIADWTPNPFYRFNEGTNLNANSRRLTLVDGGEDGQNIPLHPLIQPVRDLDVIFAVDSSADTSNNYPNGTSLVATYRRSLNATIENGTAFPYVPDVNTFVNLGLNNRPTFFGCNASNYTDNQVPGPLIVYLPNGPYITDSGVGTFDLQYNMTYRDAIVKNGYLMATQGNGTLDAQWPVCVGCAMLERSLSRTRTPLPDACTQCFQRYCWDGRTNASAPAPYTPAPKLQTVDIGKKNAAAAPRASGLAAVGVAVALGLVALA